MDIYTFWLIIFLIVILTVVAVILATHQRRRRLEKKIRIELINLGNVESHYHLRAEELTGDLTFQFLQNGTRLPDVLEPVPAQSVSASYAAPAPVKAQGGPGLGDKANKAMGISSLFATLLNTVASIFPSSGMGSSLSKSARQVNNANMQASRVQTASSQANQLSQQVKPGAPAQTQIAAQPVAAPVPAGVATTGRPTGWSESAMIPAGAILVLDLLVRSRWIARDVPHAFQIKSRAVEDSQGTLSVEDGQVLVRGGFWSHHVYPYLLIAVCAIVLVALTVWQSGVRIP